MDASTKRLIDALEMHREWIIEAIEDNINTAALVAVRDIDKHVHFLKTGTFGPKPQTHDNAAAATTSATGEGLEAQEVE